MTTRAQLASQLATNTFLTFGGNETYLQFIQRYPLREFCAFEVVYDDAAWSRLEDELLRPIAEAAASQGLGLLTDSFVWRASADYVERLGHGARGLQQVNTQAVARTRSFIERFRAGSSAAKACPVILAADLGPRGDGYALGANGPIPIEAAYDYHAPQVEALAKTGVDLLVALTMTNQSETLGIARAAERAGLPLLVSPTVETDGSVPDGSSLADFIGAVDEATSGSAVGFIVNCAHPSHLAGALQRAADAGAPWLARLRGLRVNASAKSHAELDSSTEVDRGDPQALARAVGDLKTSFGFSIVGGCCGTDAEHLRAIAAACR
jgi:S-methylmethionine-dependent homocysteine/selenocysteine methylase